MAEPASVAGLLAHITCHVTVPGSVEREEWLGEGGHPFESNFWLMFSKEVYILRCIKCRFFSPPTTCNYGSKLRLTPGH